MSTIQPARGHGRLRRTVPAGLLAAVVWVALGRDAGAQQYDTRQGETFVVGSAGHPGAGPRLDARRTGVSRAAFPRPPVRVLWQRGLGFSVDHAPLVSAGGEITVVGTRGDVVSLDDRGVERARVSVANTTPGAAALTSDGTVVFASLGGEVAGVAAGTIRYRTRVTAPLAAVPSAVMALEDGGVAVALGRELALLDVEGMIRVRARVAEPTVLPLLSSGDELLALGASGVITAWHPGREPVRLGTLDGPADGAALFGPTGPALVAVSRGQLVVLDAGRGPGRPLPPPSAGLWFAAPATRGPRIYALQQTASSTDVVCLGIGGRVSARWPLVAAPLADAVDAGAVALPPSPSGVLIDRTGALAAFTRNRLALFGPNQAQPLFADDNACAQGAGRAALAGIAPAGAGRLLAVCDNGQLTLFEGPVPAGLP